MTHYRKSETLENAGAAGTVLNIEYNPCPDKAAARELELYADNIERLYNRREWIIRGASKAADKGKYDHAQMILALKRYYRDVAKHYTKEFGGNYRTIFPADLREWIAEKDAEELRAEILNWN